MQLAPVQRGFTLVELAIVMAIAGLMISAVLSMTTTFMEQRDYLESKRRLDVASEALLGYAITNGRLPCPAIAGSQGLESPSTASSGTACTGNFNGYLPAATIGFQPTNSAGLGIDAWGNPIRYAVASAVTAAVGSSCTGTGTPPPFTHKDTLKNNGITCVPNDLDVICSVSAQGSAGNPSNTCYASIRVVAQNTAVYVVFSTGKNGSSTSGNGADETANIDGNSTFVLRTPSDSGADYGNYDDLMVVMPVGVLYGKLMSAGLLP